nr:putative inositol monophosphatase 3 [Leptinotarsa decemlineata]
MNLGGTIHLNKSGICVLLVISLILFLYSISNGTRGNETVKPKKINLGKLLKVAIKTAESGGKKVASAKNLVVKNKGLTKEGLADRVTSADLASHCAMSESIKYFFPSVRVISEEADNICEEDPSLLSDLKKFSPQSPVDEFVEEGDVTVWIDPLDATYEFTAKMYTFVTTMVCVAVKGKPVIGVIHKPFSGSTSWAWVDKAKSVDLNTVLEKSSSKSYLNVIISLSHKGEIEKVLNNTFHDKVHIISAPGAGYKVLEVATGKCDTYLHITAIKKWDICAGNAIIDSLGGKMTTKSGQMIDYLGNEVKNDDGVIASIRHHDLFVNKL